MLEELIKEILQITDPETGERIVQRIVPRDEAFLGDVGYTPDLSVVSTEGYAFSWRPMTPLRELFQTMRYGKERAASHRIEGIYALVNMALNKEEWAGRPLHVVDMPAIILKTMGLEVPTYFDSQLWRTEVTADVQVAESTIEERFEYPAVD